MAAYALLNRNSSVIMLDCWRKWRTWIRNKRRWRAAVWAYRVAWVDVRARACFMAWWGVVDGKKKAKLRLMGLLPPVQAQKKVNQSRRTTMMKGGAGGGPTGRGRMSMYASHGEEEVAEVEHVRDFMDPFMAEGLQIMCDAQADLLSHKPSRRAYELLCRTLSWREDLVAQGLRAATQILSTGQAPVSLPRRLFMLARGQYGSRSGTRGRDQSPGSSSGGDGSRPTSR